MVVERLEKVDVEHRDDHRRARAGETFPFVLERFVEGAAVRDTGQTVGGGQRKEPVAGAFEFDVVAHARADDIGAERPRHVIGRAVLEAVRLEFGFLQPGYEDDRNRRRDRIGFQSRAERVTVHVRHDDVEQNQIGQRLRSQTERLRARRRADNRELGLEKSRDRRAARHILVDNKYASGDRHGCHGNRRHHPEHRIRPPTVAARRWRPVNDCMT